MVYDDTLRRVFNIIRDVITIYLYTLNIIKI